MLDRNNNLYIYIAILLNVIVIALFIAFVFGLKKDAFDVDTKKLDRSSLICQNSILNIVNEYDKRMNKILESYPFADFLQRVVINGVDKSERDKIISIFRSGNYAFDTVTINLAIDGKTIISSPDKNKIINIDNYMNSNSLAFFDEDYDGVYFVKSISNENGIRIGYIVASVFKKIFENTSYNLNFVVLPNGVVYYNPAIDINSISRDTLTRYMEQSDSKTITIDNYSYLLHSGKIKEIENFSIGILELNVPIAQKYLKYVLLSILSSSFIFLIISFLYDRNKLLKEIQTDIYEEEEDYNINSININAGEEDSGNDFELLSEDDINYLNDINLEDILDNDNNENEKYKEDKEDEEKDNNEEEKLNLDDLENMDFSDEDDNEIENSKNNITNIEKNDTSLDDLEELYNNLEEMEKLDENEDNIIESINDMENIINDEADILISHGSIIEEEIIRKEDEYFSSSEAFNISLNKDFLLGDRLENKPEDKINLSSINDYENETFDKEDLKDEELYNPEEVPKIPDDYYKEAEEKVRENMTAFWKNILKSIRGKKFINKNMDEMIDWIKEESGLNIKNCAMIDKDDNGVYRVSESQNLSDKTKELLKIDENEGLFKKILSNNKTLYVSDPFSSDSLKDKFDIKDREDIYHMIFVPIQNEDGELKSFFIGLSTN